MLAQLEALESAEKSIRDEMIAKSLALEDEEGKLYLSLDAVNSFAKNLLSNNPLIQVGKALQEAGVELPIFADVCEESVKLTEYLVDRLYTTMEQAAKNGIPIYQAFNARMVDREIEPDYTAVLQRWKDYCEGVQLVVKEGKTPH